MTLLPYILLFFALLLFSLLWLGLVPKKAKELARLIESLIKSMARGLAQDEYLKRYAKRHPLQINWLYRRLRLREFSGLTLTLLALAFLFTLFQLAGVTEDFVKNDTIVLIDERLDQLLLIFRSPYLVRIFLAITSLGRWETTALITTAIIIFCWINRKKFYILPLIITFAGSGITNILGKLALHRARPPFPVYQETSYSFPSGHATTAMAAYGFLLYLLMRQLKNKHLKLLAILINVGIIAAIGLSRLYLGVHYLSDVLAGYLLGLLWLITGISMVEWNLSKRKIERAKKQTNLNRLVIGITLVSIIILAVSYRPAKIIGLKDQSPIIINNLFDLPAGFPLPRVTETLSATEQEPISFIIAGTESQLKGAFAAAGWILADNIDHQSFGKMAVAGFMNRPYPEAPMTPSFWNGVPHDFGFEKSTAEQSFRQRHHARFWISNLDTPAGKQIFVGTASYDSGLKWGVTHRIAPDIDTERELLFQDLNSAGKILTSKKINFVRTVLGKNFTGDQFFTDGQAYIIELR